jgi:hypothetical protein
VPLVGTLVSIHRKMILNSVDVSLEARYCFHRYNEEIINIYTMSYSALINICGILMLALVKIALSKNSIGTKMLMIAKCLRLLCQHGG